MAETDAVPAEGLPQSRAGSPAAIWVLLPLAVAYYLYLLTALGSIGLFQPLPHGLTFNSMLLHLLDGRFDVDPAAIGHEGYLRDGAIYAYFGILPALLRAPLLALPDFAHTELTRVSCLVAVSLMALFKTGSVLVLWRSAAVVRHPVLVALMLAALLFGGAQIQFLRPSLFVESILWADACAAAFVWLVLCGWTRPAGFTAGLLSAMAVAAGLCLLTRVSTGLGLYLAFGGLWLWRGWSEFRLGARGAARQVFAMTAPLVLLFGFAAVAGFVNYRRWGDPLVFVDLSRALILQYFPERLQRLHDYGAFNLTRLGFGVLYYFLPIWILRDGSGALLWSDFAQRTIDSVELPPGSLLLSDPLLIGLSVFAAVGLARGLVPRPAPLVCAAAGLAVPGALMLVTISYAFRYRMEFYPLLELCAFVGFWRALGVPGRGAERLFAAGAAAGIVAAHAMWLLSALSPFGPAHEILGRTGIVQFYLP